MWESLEELGQVLRTEREKKYLSVEDVADGLKISSRVLRAIEAGDVASLPHAVYVRGFISAYGKFLELDVQELLATPALYDDDEKMNAPAFEQVKTAPKKQKSIIPLILALCFVLGAGLGVWFYRDAALFSTVQEEHLSAAQPAPALPQVQKKSVETKLEPAAVASSAQEGGTRSKANTAVVVQEKDVAAQRKPEPSKAPMVEKPQVAPQTAKPVISQPMAVPLNSVAQSTGPFKVIITALTNTWLHSIADNTGKRQFSLNPGDTFALTFEKSLQITLGNAGGVRIHYNGQEFSGFGKQGEEKTLTFPPKQ